jgi:hypothetical protein
MLRGDSLSTLKIGGSIQTELSKIEYAFPLWFPGPGRPPRFVLISAMEPFSVRGTDMQCKKCESELRRLPRTGFHAREGLPALWILSLGAPYVQKASDAEATIYAQEVASSAKHRWLTANRLTETGWSTPGSLPESWHGSSFFLARAREVFGVRKR